MALLNWNSDLSVKIDSIDDQHKKLFDMINDFYEGLNKNTGKEAILKLVKGMREYTQMHFTTEEGYMSKNNYPEYEAHKKQHIIFIIKVEDLEKKIMADKLVLSFEVTNFLKDWIKNHIQKTDKQYSDFLIAKGVK